MKQDEALDPRGNMRPCGCHQGRPCMCEMGACLAVWEYACGECINCQLNANALKKRRKARRKCVKYDEFMAEQAVDRLEIAPGCVLRMRKPDWDVTTKAAFYTRMRQLRLGLVALRIDSADTLERQLSLRRKYNRDLLRAQEAIQRAAELRQRPGSIIARRMTAETTHIDSDVFDAHSTQLIPAETVLPELQARVDAATKTIATTERTLQVVEAYVERVAVTKLQATAREYIRSMRWKRIWFNFREDVDVAAAVVIQSLIRMSRCRGILPFLRSLTQEARKHCAAQCLHRFFLKLKIAKQLQQERQRAEALAKVEAARLQSVQRLFDVNQKIICRIALWTWSERQREATAHGEHRVLGATITIQRYWRGLRARLYFRRARHRHHLSPPVMSLYDKFVCHGDLWRLLFDFDAMIRRYEERERQEQEDATTFLTKMVREKQQQEDNMMQAWLTASALDSPIIKGATGVLSAFEVGSSPVDASPLSNAILHSPLASGLVALSSNNRKSDVFPDDLPPQVIRQAMYEGFSIKDTVAVMRGLIAQGKDATDVHLVVKVLKSRAPLMRNSWQPERVARRKARPNISQQSVSPSNQALRSPDGDRQKIRTRKAKPPRANADKIQFFSDNMLDNIPAGLNGPIDHLLLVAALRCFDPEAPRVLRDSSSSSNGAFVFRVDVSTDPWRSYVHTAAPLMKIRREQIVQAAIKPHLQLLRGRGCFSAFDILKTVRGMDELVAWGIPRPLAVSMYDVIELIHKQSVNRSDRNIKRQLCVSAQFEAFARKRDTAQLPSVGTEDTEGIERIKVAIDRDVLELPVTNPAVSAESIVFKACFQLCAEDLGQEEMFATENYRRFLSQLVNAQRKQGEDLVQELVKKRIKTATTIASPMQTQLKALCIETSAQLKNLQHQVTPLLPSPIASKIADLLSTLPDTSTAGALGPDLASQRLPLKGATKMAPLIKQSKTTVDVLDKDLRSISIPF